MKLEIRVETELDTLDISGTKAILPPQGVNIRVVLTLSYLTCVKTWEPVRSATVHMRTRDAFGDLDRMRAELLRDKHVTAERDHWSRLACPDLDEPIDTVEIIDPLGLLEWLRLDPSTLLPNDLKPR